MAMVSHQAMDNGRNKHKTAAGPMLGIGRPNQKTDDGDFSPQSVYMFVCSI